MSISHLYVLFGEVPIQDLCPFFNWIVWGVGVGVEFCKVGILTPYQMYQWDVLPFCRLSFYFIDDFLYCAKPFYVFKDCIYLFSERKGGREREGEKHQCVVASYAPPRGPGPQPRHVPQLGIEPVTHCFTGRHSLHRAMPARAQNFWVWRSPIC